MTKLDFKKIYQKSSVRFQNFIISVYGYKIFKQRYGKIYYEEFDRLIKKDYSNINIEKNIQNNKLHNFVNFAVDNSSFYKHLYKNIDVSNIKTVSDLHKLPIVDKETLRASIEDVYTIDPSKAIESYTGGTTGKSLKVLFTKEDFQKRMAYLDAFKYKIGIKDPFKIKKATFSGRDLIGNQKKKTVFWRYNAAYNQRLYSTFHLTETNLPYYLKDLNSFKPEILNGFVSSIYEVAEYIKRNDIVLQFHLKAIFTTSETLLPHHKSLIEEVFKTKVYNQYASAEGAPFVTQCSEDNLHYNLDTGVIENIVIEGHPQMVVTSFTTHGTPLIRYNIGDAIIFKEGECTCGSSHPLVNRIEGRRVDYLESREKGKVSLSHLADVIKGIPNSIIKMQFHQISIDEITLFFVVDKNSYTVAHSNSIIYEMHNRFGKQTKINIEIVEDIPKEKSGKYRLIKKY